MPLRPVRIALSAVDRFTKPIAGFRSKLAGLNAPVRNLRRSFRQLSDESGLTRLGSVIGSVARRVALLSAAGAALGIVGFKKFLDQGDRLVNLSAKLGISVQKIQGLEFAAEQSGISASSLEGNLVRLSRAAAEFAAGKKGDPARALKALSVAVKDANGRIRPTPDLLADVDVALRRIDDPAVRTRIAMALFGRGGAEMLKLLGKQSDTLPELLQLFHDLGGGMSGETAEAADKLGDSMSQVGVFLKRIRDIVSAALLPKVQELTTRLLDWGKANRELINTRVTAFVQGLIAVIGTTVSVLSALVSGVRTVVDFFGGWKVVTAALAIGLTGALLPALAAAALGLFFLATAASPITLVAFAIAGLVLLAGAIVRNWQPIKDFFAGLWTSIAAEFTKNVDFIKGLLDGLLVWIRDKMALVGDLVPDFVKQGLAFPFSALPDPGTLAAAGGQSVAVGGRLDIVVDSEGSARVKRLQSTNSDVEMAVTTGRAHLGG